MAKVKNVNNNRIVLTGPNDKRPGVKAAVKTVCFGGASAPRLLGVLAPDRFQATTPWKPEFDFAKAVQAGILVIRDAAGAEVRSIPTPASEDGSIRDLVWDGRDAQGKPVAGGEYTWELRVAEAGGSQEAEAIDGSGPVSGKVQVLAAPTPSPAPATGAEESPRPPYRIRPRRGTKLFDEQPDGN